MEKIIIKLIEQPHICACGVDIFNNIPENSKEYYTDWCNFCFYATAKDDKGNTYKVYWLPSNEEFDTDNGNEEDCCDWEKPVMVITEDENGRDINVLSKAKIEL